MPLVEARFMKYRKIVKFKSNWACKWQNNPLWCDVLTKLVIFCRLESSGHAVAKRQAGYSQATCSFIDTTCIESKACGTLPLYSNMAKEDIPTFGEGVAPWLVQVYVEGKYRCDGTLVSPRWVLTHAACANEVLPQKFSVARLGMYWNMEPRFLSAPEQVSLQAELFCHFLSIEIRIFYLIRYQIDIFFRLFASRYLFKFPIPKSHC